MEFTITSATFTKDEGKGIYTLTINYQPIDNYKQFVITKDIVFNYEIPETASKLTAKLDETFTTNLGVAICGCALTNAGRLQVPSCRGPFTYENGIHRG